MMHIHKEAAGQTSQRAGFTLVELVVAGAILAVAVFAVVAVVRKGREMQVNDDYRRRARAAIHTKFETTYDFRNFNTIAEGTVTETDTIAIKGGNPVIDTIITVVDEDTPTVSSTAVPMKKVTITVKWPEIGMSSEEQTVDSVWMSKWIAKAKE
jgi:Tfp pilus assembly protein PilE